jgi:hypothetical protein
VNVDIVTGDWRYLNLQAAPFFLPRPIRWIDEQGREAAKHLALWKFADIP